MVLVTAVVVVVAVAMVDEEDEDDEGEEATALSKCNPPPSTMLVELARGMCAVLDLAVLLEPKPEVAVSPACGCQLQCVR